MCEWNLCYSDKCRCAVDWSFLWNIYLYGWHWLYGLMHLLRCIILPYMSLWKPLNFGDCGKIFILNMCDALIDIQFSVIWVSQLNGCIILVHNIAATTGPMSPQWGAQGNALSNQTTVWLVLPSFNNQHDTNWIKWEFVEDQILHLPTKTAHIRHS